MDIGGIDTVIESSWPPNLAALVVMGYFYTEYPKGCHENDDLENDDLENDDLDGRREFFFYTSPEAKQAWDEDGYTDEFGPEMFHVICERIQPGPPYQVTIVHDREGYDFSKIKNVLTNNSAAKIIMSAAEAFAGVNSALQQQPPPLQ